MHQDEPRIEIFAPFGEAFDLTTNILFKPFAAGKWFVIGFAAWLATFTGGLNFSFRNRFDKAQWDLRSQHAGPPFSWHDVPPWVLPVVMAGFLLLLALMVVLLWVNARGRFMFTDCIVRNRAAIADPWREFRREGNSYCVFQVVFAFCNLLVFGGIFSLIALGWYWNRPVVPIAPLILVGVVYILVFLIICLILKFMVPVMYRQRCNAAAAFRQIWALLIARPGIFVLFALFYFLLLVATTMVGCLAACLTCCLAAIPYLGTVLLLPLVMFLFAYPLCFLGQFGDAYNAFAVADRLQPPPVAVPPVQQDPPSSP